MYVLTCVYPLRTPQPRCTVIAAMHRSTPATLAARRQLSAHTPTRRDRVGGSRFHLGAPLLRSRNRQLKRAVALACTCTAARRCITYASWLHKYATRKEKKRTAAD